MRCVWAARHLAFQNAVYCHLLSFSEQKEILKEIQNLLPWRSLRRNQKVCGKEFVQPLPGRLHWLWWTLTPSIPPLMGAVKPPAFRFYFLHLSHMGRPLSQTEGLESFPFSVMNFAMLSLIF